VEAVGLLELDGEIRLRMSPNRRKTSRSLGRGPRDVPARPARDAPLDAGPVGRPDGPVGAVGPLELDGALRLRMSSKRRKISPRLGSEPRKGPAKLPGAEVLDEGPAGRPDGLGDAAGPLELDAEIRLRISSRRRKMSLRLGCEPRDGPAKLPRDTPLAGGLDGRGRDDLGVATRPLGDALRPDGDVIEVRPPDGTGGRDTVGAIDRCGPVTVVRDGEDRLETDERGCDDEEARGIEETDGARKLGNFGAVRVAADGRLGRGVGRDTLDGILGVLMRLRKLLGERLGDGAARGTEIGLRRGEGAVRTDGLGIDRGDDREAEKLRDEGLLLPGDDRAPPQPRLPGGAADARLPTIKNANSSAPKRRTDGHLSRVCEPFMVSPRFKRNG
jgi:hypothetical protein